MGKASRIFRRLWPALAALASVALLILSNPPFTYNECAWFALVPLLFVARYRSLRASVGAFATAGIAWYAVSFIWMKSFHALAIPALILVVPPLFFVLPLCFARAAIKGGSRFMFLAPCVWVIGEYVKDEWFLSFPFGTLGYTQFDRILVIQAADAVGVHGLSWLIVFVNAAIFLAINRIVLFLRTRDTKPSPWIPAAAAPLVIGCMLAYGFARTRSVEYSDAPALKVGFAQTLFHPKESWNSHGGDYAATIQRLGGRFKGMDVDLLLFPELTINRPLSFDPSIRLDGNAALLNSEARLANDLGAYVLMGCQEKRIEDGTTRTYNSMFLFSPDYRLTGVYRKRHLVPFGERNPFKAVFPGLSGYLRATTGAKELDPGGKPSLFSVQGKVDRILKFGTLICFESASGELARKYVGDGADFLVVATNDFWSLSKIAAIQHASFSVIRAVESRVPVLRIANGGLSGYVDERGKYATSLGLFTEGVMTARLFLPEKRMGSLYAVLGDWVVLASAIAAFAYACVFAWQLIRSRKRSAPDQPATSPSSS